MDLQKFLDESAGKYLPNLSVDLVVIGYQGDRLKCLLLRIGEVWVLPGGHILMEESVEVAADRILKERTGLEKPHLKFLSVFGEPDRSFGDEFRQYFEERGLIWRKDHWMNSRFVSLGYYSLVNMDETHPVPGVFDEEVRWFDMEKLPQMGLDHATIVQTARNRLKDDIRREQLTYNLLPSPFTMPELHRLHQVILEEELDRSRFQKQMLATDRFERLPQLKKESRGRSPYRYRVKD